jgi:hypothetical protein
MQMYGDGGLYDKPEWLIRPAFPVEAEFLKDAPPLPGTEHIYHKGYGDYTGPLDTGNTLGEKDKFVSQLAAALMASASIDSPYKQKTAYGTGPIDNIAVPLQASELTLGLYPTTKPNFSGAEQDERQKRERKAEAIRKAQAAIEADRTEMQDGIETRGWVRNAPLISGILADESEMQRRSEFPFYHTAGLGDISEADALRDFETRLIEVEAILNSKKAKHDLHLLNSDTIAKRIAATGMLRDSLSFIGTPELQEAWGGLAAYWLQKIQSGKNLYIAIGGDESSCYVYQNIVDELAKHDPKGKYAKKVHPFDPANTYRLDNHTRKFMEEQCIIVVDDWDITGGQARSTVDHLKGFKKDNMEINFVCATSKALVEGVRGVLVKGYFKRDSPDDHYGSPSIAGAHCVPDFGFIDLLYGIYAEVKKIAGYENYPPPVLTRVAKLYKSTEKQNILRHAVERRQVLLDQMARYATTFAGVINKLPA